MLAFTKALFFLVYNTATAVLTEKRGAVFRKDCFLVYNTATAVLSENCFAIFRKDCGNWLLHYQKCDIVKTSMYSWIGKKVME